jgi:hypothetical protein
MTIRQMIRGASPRAYLGIHATLRSRAMWPPHNARIPSTNSTVTITGALLSVEGDVAVMAVDDIAYIPRPSFPTLSIIVDRV